MEINQDGRYIFPSSINVEIPEGTENGDLYYSPLPLVITERNFILESLYSNGSSDYIGIQKGQQLTVSGQFVKRQEILEAAQIKEVTYRRNGDYTITPTDSEPNSTEDINLLSSVKVNVAVPSDVRNQEKEVNISSNENGIEVLADEGYSGLGKVTINANVPTRVASLTSTIDITNNGPIEIADIIPNMPGTTEKADGINGGTINVDVSIPKIGEMKSHGGTGSTVFKENGIIQIKKGHDLSYLIPDDLDAINEGTIVIDVPSRVAPLTEPILVRENQDINLADIIPNMPDSSFKADGISGGSINIRVEPKLQNITTTIDKNGIINIAQLIDRDSGYVGIDGGSLNVRVKYSVDKIGNMESNLTWSINSDYFNGVTDNSSIAIDEGDTLIVVNNSYNEYNIRFIRAIVGTSIDIPSTAFYKVLANKPEFVYVSLYNNDIKIMKVDSLTVKNTYKEFNFSLNKNFFNIPGLGI